MSFGTSRTPIFSALVIDRQRCCLAQYMPSMGLRLSAAPKHSVRNRSFKPGHPIHYPKSQDPGTLTAFATRRTASKSP
jgi:hypothetical protein